MNRKIGLIILSLIAIVLCSNCNAGSIWAKRDKNMRNPYDDDVARHIGDIITITISEESTVDNKAQRKLEKTTKRNQNFNGNLSIEHVIPSVPAVNFGTGTEYSNNLNGKADYKYERKFIDSITVVVIDIMPNGNLVVSGSRNRDIAGDTQTIEVSGIVRPSDISYQNSVKSERIAEFRLNTKNGGVSAPYTKTSWLSHILDVIWPF
ncbi:MAG: flagellar basal body L-ring protein FlgH [Candidatus Brocadiia bacterium]|nr:MAG: flagellar basal body L-ring protein FlgH [Candidatus Brocadiia bacterium]